MKKRLAAFLAVVLMAALGTQVITGDGTEQLGTPSIPIADGTDVITAGTGMIAQPGIIDINVPAGATVEQVLLYWEGQFVKTGTVGDDTISVDGNSVTGTLIWIKRGARLSGFSPNSGLRVPSLAPRTSPRS